jgi:16S rRNA (cytosine1402-N4)-methyltransferase
MTHPLHIPVLLREVLEVLSPRPGEVYLDCTAGLGGHASAVAERLGPEGTVVLCDLDRENLFAAKARVEGLGAARGGGPRVVALHGSYSDAPRRLVELGLRADMVLADLGFASNQMDSPERGLSFSREGPLDMRLDLTSPITAAELVNTLPVRELAEILKDLGEEPRARVIAEKIAEARREEPIATTARLAEIVRSVVPRRHGPGSIDPATRTFQALRIAVNDELGRLGVFLGAIERAVGAMCGGAKAGGGGWLNSGARVAIIAFHSLEDRPVKRCGQSLGERGLVRLLTKKPLEAGDDEVAANPRSRSAKLRAFRVVGGSEAGDEPGAG